MEALTKSRTSTPCPFDADRHESEEKLHLFKNMQIWFKTKKIEQHSILAELKRTKESKCMEQNKSM